MRSIIIILSSALCLSSFAQVTGERFEVSSAGGDATVVSGHHVSYTVGGLVVETSSTPLGDVTQGFEQPTDDSNGTFTSVKPPNAFSPDGDGVNDFWIVDLPDHLMDVVDLTVLNRWGDQISYIEDYNNTTNVWDGTYQSSGKPVVAGTYFFIMEASEYGGKKTGWIQVVRNN